VHPVLGLGVLQLPVLCGRGPPNLEALSASTVLFLEQVPVGELVGAKLSRLLDGFLQREVLPQARRAAGQGLDPTPLYAVAADVLRRYAAALDPPDVAG
jgi:hypothetical protein